MGQMHRGDAGAYLRQAYSAERLMSAYSAYAVSIGCHIQGDEIACDSHQSRLLEAKWDELTGALFHGED